MDNGHEIAVIGLACRFPGAKGSAEFWANLEAGVESVTELTNRDLRSAGVGWRERTRPGYVRAAPLLDAYDRFDAAFFGYSPREAAALDPQQRVFLECAWTAVEDAGYAPSRFPGAIGVFAGSALNTYLLHSGVADRLRDDYLLTLIANDKDYLATRVSYKLGLTGPSMSVQTACSTSLVAVHLACQSLLTGECELALAGGVSVKVPQRAGYRHETGGVLSPDGHCRAFDADAGGTLFGSGAGAVVLKPLADALADGDTVRAVIKGSAVNNDGFAKVDYTAPSVTGQAEVIAEALAHAEVDPSTVSYVEAHGTGTALGDPIEIAALTAAFQRGTRRTGYCAIGSVKTNLGHLDAAAGIAGLIKTILSLEHETLPPSLHYRRPNPRIDFAATPFHVNAERTRWLSAEGPRRAGISSLGIGGTNAHLVVEQAPPSPPPRPSRPYQLLALSAATPSALETLTANLVTRLDTEIELADAAYTLQIGREPGAYRRTVVCRDRAEAVTALREAPRVSRTPPETRPVAFLFPGGGSAGKPGLVAELAAAEPLFRERLESGLAELAALGGPDLSGALLGGERISDRPLTQLPALFLVEDALAGTWRSWGVRPAAILGHSLGELTAAHLAGVLDFPDALGAVLTRARLVQSTAPGAMLSVALPEPETRALMGERLDLAAVNTPGICVVSGAAKLIDDLESRLAARDVTSTRIPLSTAGHSRLFDPIVAPYERYFAGVRLSAPSIPFLSNLTGTWITDEQATDPAYWGRQLRGTVRFADCVTALLDHPGRVCLEVGPGRTLSSFVRARTDRPAVSSLHPASGQPALLDALGGLWRAGVEIDWAGFAAREDRRRIPLPTYPFEGERHWYAKRGRPRRPRGSGRTVSRGSTMDFPGPGTETERVVAAIWREALGVPRLSVHDDFFALGGSSLLVAEVIKRVNARFRTELSLLTLIESPTVAGLADCVDAVRAQSGDRAPDRVPGRAPAAE
ncbi:hypothetical protein BS329_08865 [Amycolatopsis coloradensis]|uniref:Uncharacterized protein n=1 Tax=Amycolatopsis coloradensis TaxID=76021 RepID=A0A1R0KZ51_9PSEU|nr:type I polyketide synthase [Amycolatopsis coloradensis]OLZ54618.1 hypothetical protein BS329_08865 [Amycolatopsis coloradensis]